MGEADGRKGVWSYVRGGMGRVSDALAAAGREAGAEYVTNADVQGIEHAGGRAVGVRLGDGSVIRARKAVVSNVSPAVAWRRRVAPSNVAS